MLDAALITAMALAVGSIGGLWKVLAEVRGMRMEQDRQARLGGEVHEQIVNSHAGKAILRDDIDLIKDGQLRHDRDLARLNSNDHALMEEITRLREVDDADRAAAVAAHQALWDALDRTRNERSAS